MKQPLKDMFKKIGGMKLYEYEDEDDTMPLVRAINTLEAELVRTKHKKIQEWGKKYHRSRKGLVKQIENLIRIARKMR